MAKAKPKSKAKLKVVPSKSAKSKKSVLKPVKRAVAPVAAKKAASKTAAKKTAPKAAAKKAGKPTAQKTSAPKGATVLSLAEARKKQSTRDWSKIISPLDDRVLVQLISEERVTAGGLYIPDTASVTGNQQAAVVAVGRGHRDKKGRIRPLELKVGDRVLIAQYAGTTVVVDGEDLQIVRESEVLGTVINSI